MIPLSPSSMKMFRDCPKKFHAQNITREVKWVQSPQSRRGDIIHKCMERTIKYGKNAVKWPEGEKALYPYAQAQIDSLLSLRQNGWFLESEIKLATNGLGAASGWSDDDVLLRCKVDVLAWHPQKNTGLILDWKTGKRWDDELQLHVNAMCAAPYTGIKKWSICFCYLDLAKTDPYEVEVDFEQPALFDRKNIVATELLDTLLVIDDIKNAFATDTWPAKKNIFCKGCQINCKYNGG